MKRAVVFILILIASQNYCLAKSSKIDSLQSVLNTNIDDTVKLKIYRKILDLCSIEDNLKYAQEAISFIDQRLVQTSDNPKRVLMLKYKADYLRFITYYFQESKKRTLTKD